MANGERLMGTVNGTSVNVTRPLGTVLLVNISRERLSAEWETAVRLVRNLVTFNRERGSPERRTGNGNDERETFITRTGLAGTSGWHVIC